MAQRSSSKSIMTVAVGNLAAPLAAFASSPIMAHALGVSGRGEVAAGTSILLLFSAIGTFGLTDAATYFVAARIAGPRAVLKRASLYLLIIGVLLTVASYFIAPYMSGGSDDVTRIIRFAGLAIAPTLILGAFRGIAQGSHHWGIVNTEKYVTALFRVAPLLILFWTGNLTPVTAVLTVVSAPVFGGLAYLLLLTKEPAASLPMPVEPRLFRYGFGVWIGSLSGVLLSRLDQALITPLNGVYALGLYVVAVNLADLLLIVQGAVGQVLFATDARDQNDERMYVGSRLSLLAAIASALILGALIEVWISMLFGPEFLAAGMTTVILLIAHVIGSPGSVAGTATSARGRPGLRSFAIMTAALVNAGLLLVLVPPLGANGAALATLAGTISGTALNLFFAKRYFQMRIWLFCVPRPTDLIVLRQTASRLRRH